MIRRAGSSSPVDRDKMGEPKYDANRHSLGDEQLDQDQGENS
jgi:hypothetical protein